MERLLHKHKYEGVEFDWLGVDEDGYVGLFSSAGFGYVPKHACDEGFFEELWYRQENELPLICEARSAQRPWNQPVNDWLDLSRRGFFAYNWNHAEYYEMVCRPVPLSSPLHIRTIENLGVFDEYIRVARKYVLSVKFIKTKRIYDNVTIKYVDE